ncbi:BaeS Signal transduction histidine kinase [Candidatus Pelagibacterales bacterium]|jgi:two-component system, OmpR family, phosphate regulon sensor histidine kinase PhoR
MLKIISTIGFLVTLVLFLNSDITFEILFVINIFFIIIFFYKPISTTRSFQKNNTEISGDRLTKNDLQELFINQLEDIIIILNKFNIITYSNKAAVENFGSNIEGKHIGSEIRIPELLDAIDNNKIDKELKKIDIELKIPVFKFYKISIASIKSDHTLVIIRDFTEMRKSQNMRSDFIANASHELRTPLVSLKGFLETITDSAKDDPKSQKKFLEIMKSEANKMEVLIEDLMLLSRIELQEHIRLKDKVDIKEVIENVILLNSKKISEKKLNVNLNIKEKERFVIGDKEKLSAVFLNLLDNAIKYSGNSKSVKIESFENTSGLKNYTSISVVDEGFGIAPEDIHRITERFFRTENAKKLKIEGTGLGLAITKHIINQHRGELKITSKFGKGSEFIVSLPKH